MKYFFLLLTLLVSGVSFSQSLAPCATPGLKPEQQAFLSEFQKNNLQADFRGATYYLPVKVHVVGKDDGTGHMSKSDVFRIICDLNEDFTDASIYFYLYGDINYINNTSYYDHDWLGGYNMMSGNNIPQAVNIYFVSNASGACGYYSPMNDALAITNSCAGTNSTTLAHEMGHYLSMPHTFNGWEGHDMTNPIPTHQREKVDGTNCSTTGDGFCDTPADYISDRWNCPYGGPALIDPNGDTVVPDGTNYMAYSDDACQDKFSAQQMAAMRAYISTYKGGIAGNSSNGFVTLTTPSTVTPAMGETLINNEVTFRWNKVPNATKYYLEVSALTVMINKNVDVIITDTFFTFSDLEINKNYKWRVKALAPGNLCEPTSGIKNFTTGSFGVGIADAPVQELSFEVFPNPISKKDKLNVMVNVKEMAEGQLEVYSLTGSLLQIHPVSLHSGQNNLSIDLSGLTKGMYIIRYNSPEARISRRFLIAE